MRLFGPKTVDEALYDLQEAVVNLDTAQEVARARASQCTHEIERLTEERETARAEANRAARISERLVALLS